MGTVTTVASTEPASVTNSGTTSAAILEFEIPKGEKGDTGPQGVQGPQGEQGIQGPKGDKGDTGDTGPQGIQGIQGPIGPAGPQGEQGPQGIQGSQGVQGERGLPGKDAYTAATEAGYTGTETEFNTALSGVPGHIASTNNPHGVTAAQIGAAQAEHTHSEYAEKANASGGFAGGTGASATDGGAVGENANATVGGAVGWNASATTGGAIGNATVTQNGGAVGFAACTSDGFAGGNQAMAVDDLYNPIDAIQLGTGTNKTAKTLKVYSYQLMDASGKIPVGRIPTIPIANGGTGVSSMVGTDYTTNRPRGIVLQSSTPTSVSNGCIVGVYE